MLLWGAIHKVVPEPSPLCLQAKAPLTLGAHKSKWHFYDREVDSGLEDLYDVLWKLESAASSE